MPKEVIDYRPVLSKYTPSDRMRMVSYIIEDCIGRYGIIELRNYYTFSKKVCINLVKTNTGCKFLDKDIEIILFD